MTILAVVDIGTNTTRLLVRDLDEPKIDLTRIVKVTGLGKEVEKTGELGEVGMEQTTKAVLEYVDVAKSFGATLENILIFATAGARSAKNGDSFIEELAQNTGCKCEIISGEFEGQCSFIGAMSGMRDTTSRSVVFDIGGGSTEFALSSSSDSLRCENVVSIPIGSVRITKRHIESDPPKPEELTNAIADTREYLKDVEYQIPEIHQAIRWIGVAATVTTTAAIELGLAEFDAQKIHEFVLTRAMVEDVFRTLATESFADRIHNPGLEKERADVIVGGVAIIVSIMRHFELAEITVSCTDLVDGLWLSVARKNI